MCKICIKHKKYKESPYEFDVPYFVEQCTATSFIGATVYISKNPRYLTGDSTYDIRVASTGRGVFASQLVRSYNIISKGDFVIIKESNLPNAVHCGFTLRRL